MRKSYWMHFGMLSVFLAPTLVFANFDDVPADHPHADAIAYVQEKGIVSGYPEGNFYPNQIINRAEFVKIIIEGLRLTEPAPTPLGTCTPEEIFPDITPATWYVSYSCIARRRGFIQGYPDGLFHGERNINFAEAAKIIAKAWSLDEECEDKECPYEGSDHPWYEKYVRALEERRAIHPSFFSFDQEVTRGQMAETIYRLIAGITPQSWHGYDDLTPGGPWKNWR